MADKRHARTIPAEKFGDADALLFSRTKEYDDYILSELKRVKSPEEAPEEWMEEEEFFEWFKAL